PGLNLRASGSNCRETSAQPWSKPVTNPNRGRPSTERGNTTMKAIRPEHFINRELSWLEFNQRVLDEALNPATPLLERLKFFCITSSNLDEFFEVRVAGLKQQIESEVVERSIDGLTASETFHAVSKRVQAMVREQYACWCEQL